MLKLRPHDEHPKGFGSAPPGINSATGGFKCKLDIFHRNQIQRLRLELGRFTTAVVGLNFACLKDGILPTERGHRLYSPAELKTTPLSRSFRWTYESIWTQYVAQAKWEQLNTTFGSVRAQLNALTTPSGGPSGSQHLSRHHYPLSACQFFRRRC